MPWYNPIDWFTGIDAEIERGQELDRQIAEFNQRKVVEGDWAQEDLNQFARNNEYAEAYQSEVDRAFWDGAAEGWDRMTAPISSAVDTGKGLLATWGAMQLLFVILLGYVVVKFVLPVYLGKK